MMDCLSPYDSPELKSWSLGRTDPLLNVYESQMVQNM